MMKQFQIIVLLLAAPVVFAASLEELTGIERAAALNAGGIITEVQLKAPAPQLLPRHAALQQIVIGLMNSLEPTLFVETLYCYRKPQSAGGGDPAGWSAAERAGLFNQLLAISSLAGIQYYSASRKTMRTFYETSRVIDGPDSKKILPDPSYAEPPPAFTLYARQKDLTFGDNIYRYDFNAMPDALVFVQENLTAMTAGIIPAVGKNKLRTTMAVINSGDSLLIYAVSMAKAASLPGMDERIGNSFTNRAEAVLKWFSGRADKVFGK